LPGTIDKQFRTNDRNNSKVQFWVIWFKMSKPLSELWGSHLVRRMHKLGNAEKGSMEAIIMPEGVTDEQS